MFMVTEEERAAIRRAFDEGGEWPAVAERRRFFKIDDNADALRMVQTIVRWRSAEKDITRRET